MNHTMVDDRVVSMKALLVVRCISQPHNAIVFSKKRWQMTEEYKYEHVAYFCSGFNRNINTKIKRKAIMALSGLEHIRGHRRRTVRTSLRNYYPRVIG